MKISLNWLKEYVDLEGISVDEIVDSLTTSGLEVEEVIDETKNFENIVVGLVKEVKKHPNADKLSLCVVSDGEFDYNVVCGAPNVKKGQKSAFAKVGAYLPGLGVKLKKAKIRGEVSYGMLCAEDELGLSDNHDGIMVLDESAETGKSLSEILNKNDVVLDIAVTPNRADALSHIGVARDLSALFKRKLMLPEIKIKETSTPSEKLARVIIKNENDCPRYVAKVVTGVQVAESPGWLKQKLKSIGLRPINNIVDVTNFVLHEVGQPLHAFDLDRLADKTIIVDNAKNGEKFVTLDGKERELEDSFLMINDGKKPVAIAGVMGGENSEVSENTKNILIESAYFNPGSIRKTAKRLGLSTDASYRFERGCNPAGTVNAARRAAQLISRLTNGNVAKGEIDIYPNPIAPLKVSLRFERLNKILGFKVKPEDVEEIFKYLDFKIEEKSEERLTLIVPLARHDIEREIDLIEEVARIYGFDKIPLTERISVALNAKVDQTDFDFTLRNYLASLGYFEIITNSLLNEKDAKFFGTPVEVLSPQTTEMSHARTSLIPGMLQTISRNLRVKEKNLKLYEIGHIFELKNEGVLNNFDDLIETEHLLFAITGKELEGEWYGKDLKFDIFHLTGDFDELLRKVAGTDNFEEEYNFNTGKIFEYSVTKKIKQKVIAKGGKISDELLKKNQIDQEVFLFDLNVNILSEIQRDAPEFNELLKYPKIVRDVAFVLDKNIMYKDVVKEILKGSSKLLKKIKLFDIFESESLGAGKKSMAFQLEYYNYSRTLTEEEIDRDFWNAIETVKKQLNAELRDK